MVKKLSQIVNFLKKDKRRILLILIFAAHIFLRFYQLEERAQFNWDQVDNAWAAKNILIEHKLPLLGPYAKGSSSGIQIGPAYYYLITPFYWLFKLDPIASPIFAGITSIFTFFVLFYIIKKLFSFNIALIAVFINTVAFSGMGFDRTQWNVNFLPSVSLIILYALYKVLNGSARHLLLLAAGMGALFHIHLTAIFFPMIVLLTSPLIIFRYKDRKKEFFKYLAISAPLFLIWFVPLFISNLQTSAAGFYNLSKYLQTYYHGFHLTRVLQLLPDAFIQFDPYLFFQEIKLLKYILLPIFSFVLICKIFNPRVKVSYPILSYPILSYPILSYPILSYPIVSGNFMVFGSMVRIFNIQWRDKRLLFFSKSFCCSFYNRLLTG